MKAESISFFRFLPVSVFTGSGIAVSINPSKCCHYVRFVPGIGL